jgi:ubiquinol-cytochrome c reductase iron-sulfur subunit
MSGSPPAGVTRWIPRIVTLAFLVTAAAAVGVTAVYWTGGDPQAEGALLGVAFLALGAGLVLWAHHLLPRGPYVEPRPDLQASSAEEEATDADFERGGVLTRRRMMVGGLGTALLAMLAAAVFPVRSLGPRPRGALEHTPWRRGRALVTDDGREVRADDVPEGGLVTVFPDGHAGSADGQVVLMRVDPARLRRSRSAAGAAAGGILAFSKVCTHAGCPVGLYQAQSHQLLCPCHQSAFDVLDGARPVFGPATRSLPQLPIDVDADGVLRARSDFSEPIGPGYWSR